MREPGHLRLVTDEDSHMPRRPDPLTPKHCNVQELDYMPLHITKLLKSELREDSTGDEFKAAIVLWCESWQQVPAASLPNNDRKLANLAGVSLTEWSTLKPMALRGFVECSDGRIYHRVVAAQALKAWIGHLKHQKKSAAGNGARYGKDFGVGFFEQQLEDAEAFVLRLRRFSAGEVVQIVDFPDGGNDLPDGENSVSLGDENSLRRKGRQKDNSSSLRSEESSTPSRARKPMAEPGEEGPAHPGFDPDDDEPERESSPADPPLGDPGRELEPAGAQSDLSELLRWHDRLCAAAGPGLIDPAKSQRLHLSKREIARWREAGVDLEAHAVPTVHALTMQPRPDDPIDTWKYFTKAVLKAVAESRVALEVPDAARNSTRQRRGSGSHLDAIDQLILEAEIREGKRPAEDAF